MSVAGTFKERWCRACSFCLYTMQKVNDWNLIACVGVKASFQLVKLMKSWCFVTAESIPSCQKYMLSLSVNMICFAGLLSIYSVKIKEIVDNILMLVCLSITNEAIWYLRHTHTHTHLLLDYEFSAAWYYREGNCCGYFNFISY